MLHRCRNIDSVSSSFVMKGFYGQMGFLKVAFFDNFFWRAVQWKYEFWTKSNGYGTPCKFDKNPKKIRKWHLKCQLFLFVFFTLSFFSQWEGNLNSALEITIMGWLWEQCSRIYKLIKANLFSISPKYL